MFGKEIVEASYRHISSIEHKKKSPWGYIIAGLFCIVFGLVLVLYYLPRINTLLYSTFFYYRTFNLVNFIVAVLGFLLVIIGIIAIVYSLFLTPEFKIHVVGRNPLKISGKELEDIIKIIRQYREKVEAEITK